MRILIAHCTVDYSGRLDAHLDPATRVIMHKGDGSVLIHSEGGSYKPLNWMSAPCRVTIVDVLGVESTNTTKPSPELDGEAHKSVDEELPCVQTWTVQANKTDDKLIIRIHEIYEDISYELGIEPGLQKDGVEAHLQKLLAEQVNIVLGTDWELVRREFPTAIGPVDLMVRDAEGHHVAIEVKRRGGIDGVEQLTRYLALLSRDPLLGQVRGIFAAQEITKQARTLAEDRGIECVILDYDVMRGVDDADSRLF